MALLTVEIECEGELVFIFNVVTCELVYEREGRARH